MERSTTYIGIIFSIFVVRVLHGTIPENDSGKKLNAFGDNPLPPRLISRHPYNDLPFLFRRWSVRHMLTEFLMVAILVYLQLTDRYAGVWSMCAAIISLIGRKSFTNLFRLHFRYQTFSFS